MAITADELLILIKARDDASRVFSSVRRNFATFGKDMTRIGRSMTTMVTLPIVGVGVALFKMAADAVESESLFSVVMEDMADSTRKWSEELRDQLGLNDFELRKQVSTLFLMTSAMGIQEDAALDMSKTLVELAADMSSMRNESFEVMFEKITAGITGEMEPLKRIGILVNEATTRQALLNAKLIEGSEVLTDQQKIMGRYLAIIQQTTKDVGDLARTYESPINQVRRLITEFKLAAITMGMELMPQFKILLGLGKDIMAWLKDAVTSFAALTREKQAMILRAIALVAAIGPLLVVLGGLVTVMSALISPTGLVVAAIATLIVHAKNLGVVWQDVAIVMITAWGEVVKVVNRGVTLILDGMELVRKNWNLGASTAGHLADSVEHLSLRYQVDLLDALKSIITPSRQAAESVESDFEGMGMSAEEIAAKVQAAMDSVSAAFNEINLEPLEDAVSDAADVIDGELAEMGGDLSYTTERLGQNVSRSLLMGLIEGAESKDLWDRFMRIMERYLIDEIVGLLFIGSPSKVYEGIGRDMMLGLAQGINANINLVSPGLGMAVGVGGGGGSTAPASAFPSAPAPVTHDNRRSVVIEQVVLQTGFGSKGEEQEAVRRFNAIVDGMN